jgi:hypothetical protein
MNIPRKCLLIMSLAGLGAPLLARGQQPAAPVPWSDLNACAAIPAQAERLACYDQLAARGAARVASTPSSANSAAATAASSGSQSASTAAVVAPREGFGLYKEEHPVPAKSAIKTITATVAGISYDPHGQETISLDEGAQWQLDGSDPLLASGDSVTIKRAALGSYVLTTPSGRTHRVHRLR